MLTALITGGSSGMGLEYARQLAVKGYRLVLVSNVQEQLENAEQEIRTLQNKSGYDPETVIKWADLAKQGAAYDLYSWCVDQKIFPDLLVCNAGMFFFQELFSEDLPEVETMIRLHVETNTGLCILFGNLMKKRGSGRIVIMASMAAKLPAPGIAVYSATKAYLLSFGKSLWFEMHPYGVKVTTVCPAAIATPLYRLKPSLMNLGVRLCVIHKPEWLVRRALHASEKGKRVIRPSFMNIYLPVLIAMLPAGVENRIWRKLR